MPDTEFDSLTPAVHEVRATITRLHEQLEALSDTGEPTFRAEQRLELRYQIAERTQAYYLAVRDLRRRIAHSAQRTPAP